MKREFSRFIIKCLEFLAVMAMMVTTLNMNLACLFITNQPKIPDSAKRLRKF